MPGIAFDQLTKHYGEVTALDGLSVRGRAGRITAFLGANGSGKTTSMRLLLGLSEPDSGTPPSTASVMSIFRIRPAAWARSSTRDSIRTAARRNHLRIMSAQAAMPADRVEEALDLVGLTTAAHRTGRGLLTRHAPATRPGFRTGRGPSGPRPRRAVQRPRSGRHRGHADVPAQLRRPRGHGVPLQPPAGRGGAQRRRRHRHPPGATGLRGPGRAALVGSSGRAGRHDRRRRPAGGHARATRCDGRTHEPDTLTVTGADRVVVGRAAVDVGAVVTDIHATADDLESVFADLIHHQEATS